MHFKPCFHFCLGDSSSAAPAAAAAEDDDKHCSQLKSNTCVVSNVAMKCKRTNIDQTSKLYRI